MAGRFSEAAKFGAEDNEEASAVALSKEFSRAVETVQLLKCILGRQPRQFKLANSQEDHSNGFESGPRIAERLVWAMQVRSPLLGLKVEGDPHKRTMVHQIAVCKFQIFTYFAQFKFKLGYADSFL